MLAVPSTISMDDFPNWRLFSIFTGEVVGLGNLYFCELLVLQKRCLEVSTKKGWFDFLDNASSNLDIGEVVGGRWLAYEQYFYYSISQDVES